MPADAVPAAVAAEAPAAADAVEAARAEPESEPTAVVPTDAVPADAVPAAAPADVAAEAPAEPESEPARVAAGSEGESAGAGDSATVFLAKVPAQESAVAAAVPATGQDPRVQLMTEQPDAPEQPAAPAAPTVPAQAWPPPAPVPPHPYVPTAAGVPGPPPPGYGQPYPAQPGAQPMAGGGVWALPAAYAPKQRKPRPWLRTVGRWTTAAAVAVAVGVGGAVLVTQPARTDIPGLKTPADGRYTFPALSLPTLPPAPGGLPAPDTGVHQVDLRGLLLPDPVGAKADAALPGRGGWFPAKSFLDLLANPGVLKSTFSDVGLRHIAATGWTMPDGTHTQIYLQQFRSPTGTGTVDSVEGSLGDLVAAPHAQSDPSVNLLSTLVGPSVHLAPAQGGNPSVRYGYFESGDTEVLVVMSNPKEVPTIDFEQVVDLQVRLLTAS
ncbi:hypothetical protein ABIA32_000218 [Streptacidiphilus sp. MAP12-20]|uniref:hypothetical protein n=1 Tax=Streptacidiphilus sp. MAP12-20 TaxID=3156299 RepID=UPI0035132094